MPIIEFNQGYRGKLMPNAGFPLDAYVIIDNNAIVGISEFCCSAYQANDFSDAVPLACKDIEEIFNAIRRFAIGQKVFTTPCVRDEFKPEKGDLSKYRGFQQCYCDQLKKHTFSQIEVLDVNMKAINTLRGMQHIPGRLRENLGALSDQDLSLVILALGIAHKFNERVYILVDEEDLRYYVSWIRTNREIKDICANPLRVEALHSMTYLDSVHRNCAITSQRMNAMFGFQSYKQMKRTFLNGTSKGEMITNTYDLIYQSIMESNKIKIDLKGAV